MQLMELKIKPQKLKEITYLGEKKQQKRQGLSSCKVPKQCFQRLTTVLKLNNTSF